MDTPQGPDDAGNLTTELDRSTSGKSSVDFATWGTRHCFLLIHATQLSTQLCQSGLDQKGNLTGSLSNPTRMS